MRSSNLYLYLIIGCAFLFTTCKKEDLPDDILPGIKFNTYFGPQVQVGQGHARSFATISHSGVPQELGVVFTDKALQGLPTTNTPYVLELHQKALEVTLFKHVALGWSANGHPLPGTFIESHFDVRFFMLTLAERLAIPAPPDERLTLLPPTGYMPADYYPDVPGPQLGMHWTDSSFTQPVIHELILGTYNGNFVFVSPIVLRTFLESGQSVSMPYSQPQQFAVHGYYATRYNVYDDDHDKHYVTLSNFVWR